MGQVAAVGKVEAKNGVAGLQHRHVGGGVGLRAGVRLHVGVLGPEKALGAVAGEVLDHIGELAATVVALARVALGVLVGEHGACSFEDGAADEVLGRNHLQALVLTGDLIRDLGGNFGVSGLQGRVQVDGH